MNYPGIEVDPKIKRLLGKPTDVKDIPAALKIFPLDINKVKTAVETSGVFFVSEQLLIYNKFLGAMRLSVNPQMGDQIIKVLRFSPEDLQSIYQLGYYTTGHTLSVRDNDINILIVAKDADHAAEIKRNVENINK